MMPSAMEPAPTPFGLKVYLVCFAAFLLWYCVVRPLLVQTLDFDIAVTVTEGEQKKSGIGVLVAGVGLGKSGQSDARSETVSRLRFTVPVVFPASD
jgi:hypothetical protein